jgi:uncharacterized protein YegJ (DUF2314 family)
MKHGYRIPRLATALCVLSLAGCSSPSSDPVITVDDNDAEMAAAIAKARATLPQFWQTLEHPEHGESDFSLKLKVTDSNGTEHLWLNEIERKDGKTLGTVNNDVEIVRSVKLGDRIPIPEADISDWMFTRDGKMQGSYTTRVLMKRMPPAEAEKVKQMLADP